MWPCMSISHFLHVSVLYVSGLRSDVGLCLMNVCMLPDFGSMSGGARAMFICLCYVIILCVYVNIFIRISCFSRFQAESDVGLCPMPGGDPMLNTV